MKVLDYRDMDPTPVEMEGACGANVRWLIAKDDGAPTFAMRLFELEPGGTTPLHTHDNEHEVFVLGGTGTVWRNGEDILIAAGTAIFVPPGEKHCFKNTGDEVMRFLCMVPL